MIEEINRDAYNFYQFGLNTTRVSSYMLLIQVKLNRCTIRQMIKYTGILLFITYLTK